MLKKTEISVYCNFITSKILKGGDKPKVELTPKMKETLKWKEHITHMHLEKIKFISRLNNLMLL